MSGRAARAEEQHRGQWQERLWQALRGGACLWGARRVFLCCWVALRGAGLQQATARSQGLGAANAGGPLLLSGSPALSPEPTWPDVPPC
jgi:hypothetical protein